MLKRSTEWETRGLCKCGWSRRAPFGKIFHIHVECCPSCGSAKNEWQTIRMRDELHGPEFVWWKLSTWGGNRWRSVKWSERTYERDYDA